MVVRSASEKYLWSSVKLEEWVKNQQKKMRDAGFKISTAGITHKLATEILIPNKIDLNFPTIQFKKKRKRR